MFLKPYNGCRLLLAAFLLINVLGCAHEPFDPPETGEIPKGPGVFTKGDEGVTLFDSNKKSSDMAPSEPPPAGESTTAMPMDEADYREFEAYQQWLEWKKSKAGTEEYKSFKQWQEWRNYQEWKKKN